MRAIIRQSEMRTGALPSPLDLALCPGIDVDAFKASCQAPIFPNHWNHWRLYRTTRDNPSDEDVKQTALAFLMHVFKAFDMGVVRHEDIVVVPLNDDKHSNPWNTSIVYNRALCVQPINLGHSPFSPAFRTVYARFVYRGSRQSIPWPARRVVAGVASWCPQNADWILDSVFAPSAENVPPEGKDPKLPGAIGQSLPTVPEMSTATKAALWIGGFAVAAGLVGYAIRSVR